MLELLIAAAVGGFQAPECKVAFERFEETRTVLRLRPACPIGFASTQAAVRQILEHAGEAAVVTLAFGRIERYPWLSGALARQASSSRRWNPATGRPREAQGKAVHENAYVAAALRGMPEFTALFERWPIVGVSVEKVLITRAAELALPAGAPVAPDAKLPYDVILWVTLQRPSAP